MVALIWAMAENGVIGRDNGLPWRLPHDMKFFQRTTMGKPVIMGRRTFESMKAPLPGRTNIVVTGRADYARSGIEVVHSLREAIEVGGRRCEADGVDEIIVAGGARIYAEALPVAGRLYVTDVHAELPGDTRFPDFDRAAWRVVCSRRFEADATHAHPFTISVLER